MRVAYRYIRPLTVVYARSIGPYARLVCRGLAADERLARPAASARSRVKQGYGFFRDNPKLTAPELLRYDACVPVTAGLDADPDSGDRPPDAPGRRLCRAHPRRLLRGGRRGCSRSSTARSCPSGACRVDYDRPFVAIYLNDPAVTREVHRRTELCVPVLPVRMPLSSNDDEDVHAQAHALAPVRRRAGPGLDRSLRPRDASPPA